MDQMLDLSSIEFLVVEDEEFMRNLIKRILRVLGAKEIRAVEGVAEAITALKTLEADIIILDWMMEPTDGIEFTRMIRSDKDSPISMIPIIMLTSLSESSQVSEARDAGVTEFMVKPISPKSLYLRIAEVIQRPRQFVRTTTFFGPDRHRHDSDHYTGQQRRKMNEGGSQNSTVPDGENEPTARDKNGS
jgi:two-component system chemotaxis response regulator CheY